MKTNSFLEPVVLDGENFPAISESTILCAELLSTHGSFLGAKTIQFLDTDFGTFVLWRPAPLGPDASPPLLPCYGVWRSPRVDDENRRLPPVDPTWVESTPRPGPDV